MKFFLLRIWAVWLRFRRGAPWRRRHLQYAPQVDALMRRANPFAAWSERANWMIDVAEWLRREGPASLIEESAWRRLRDRRVRYLLDWLDANRDVRRVVQATLQKTLRESVGPELFSATGMPVEHAFFSELSEKLLRAVFPRPPAQADLSTLFVAMFPDPADADWLLGLDARTCARLWKLAADDGIAHRYLQQIDEALHYLATMVIAAGISPSFRERLQPRLPIQSTPFMSLRRELEKYLAGGATDPAALRSARMLVAVCQAQTDRVYGHLDEYGVSVGLVYQVERMRAQLSRMSRLLDLRAGSCAPAGAAQVQTLLADLIRARHRRSSVRALFKRSFSLLARKMVERNADRGEPGIARDADAWRALFKAAVAGGAIAALAVAGSLLLPGAGEPHFFAGLLASLNYAAVFLAISLAGGALAARQPAVTAPVLAARMVALDTVGDLRMLQAEIAWLLRSQAAAVLGNLVAVLPVMLLASAAALLLAGAPAMDETAARAALRELSIVGFTPLHAALTGVMLWLSGLVAGVADNWFALRGMRDALTHHRRLGRALGPVRAARCAAWLERRFADIAGNLSLAVLFGMAPAVARFFGLPLEVRHVTLEAGILAAAAGSLGTGVLASPEFWLAALGVLGCALLNVGVAFGCALMLALRAREIPARMRAMVLRTLWRRLTHAPRLFLYPRRNERPLPPPRGPVAAPAETEPDGKPARLGRG